MLIIARAPRLCQVGRDGALFVCREVAAIAYKVIFSVNNNEEVFTLPHVPVDFPLPQP